MIRPLMVAASGSFSSEVSLAGAVGWMRLPVVFDDPHRIG
jgi:hypothetical protein